MNDNPTLNDVWLMLGRMDEKLNRVVKDAEKQDGRITTVERSGWRQHGYVAAISTMVSLVFAFGEWWTHR